MHAKPPAVARSVATGFNPDDHIRQPFPRRWREQMIDLIQVRCQVQAHPRRQRRIVKQRGVESNLVTANPLGHVILRPLGRLTDGGRREDEEE